MANSVANVSTIWDLQPLRWRTNDQGGGNISQTCFSRHPHSQWSMVSWVAETGGLEVAFRWWFLSPAHRSNQVEKVDTICQVQNGIGPFQLSVNICNEITWKMTHMCNRVWVGIMHRQMGMHWSWASSGHDPNLDFGVVSIISFKSILNLTFSPNMAAKCDFGDKPTLPKNMLVYVGIWVCLNIYNYI